MSFQSADLDGERSNRHTKLRIAGIISRLSHPEQLTMPIKAYPLRHLAPRFSLLVALFVVSGCASVTPINQLLNDPSRYDGKTIRVRGEVKGAVGGLGIGAYEIKDKTGTLTVVSDQGDPPRTGTNVGVKGKFQALLSLGFRNLAVLREESRFY
jgi:hypothetical protein